MGWRSPCTSSPTLLWASPLPTAATEQAPSEPPALKATQAPWLGPQPLRRPPRPPPPLPGQLTMAARPSRALLPQASPPAQCAATTPLLAWRALRGTPSTSRRLPVCAWPPGTTTRTCRAPQVCVVLGRGNVGCSLSLMVGRLVGAARTWRLERVQILRGHGHPSTVSCPHLPSRLLPLLTPSSSQIVQQPSLMTVGGLDYGPNPRTGERPGFPRVPST